MSPHPRLPGELAPADLADSEASWPVVGSEGVYASSFIEVRQDVIVDPSGGEHPRIVVAPRGAVGVLAFDDEDRVLLVEQYRHPVGRRMIELPAGIFDVVGESPVTTAARELAEEADLRAATWTPHLVVHASPGYTTEQLQVFRATGLSAIPEDERIPREAEEADLRQWFMPFADAVEAVLAGRITNNLAVAAILAEHARR
ncbi:MAG: NUDIX hydrolase [Aeromicrobium sp.]|uniref:NUDIX domain-containing protein n=1 Tax=Aeromicrobium sp. TaxID=1871063 RepID=UPI0039E50C28